jgi:ribosomal protein S18 acetylase RimI-like enzyme
MNSISRLVPSLALSRRVNETALAYTFARMKVLERIPGNPVGVAIRAFGEATALVARCLPSTYFNRVVGLRAGQAHLIQQMIEWSRERGAGGRFEIAAGDYEHDLGRELTRLGFYQSGFSAALIREPEADLPAPTGISIERISAAAEMDDFLDAYVAGWSIPEAMSDEFKANVRPWSGQPGWLLYVARIEGKPAATAILFLHDGVGYLADSATDPNFRGRGLHAALLCRRLLDAKAAGVEFVCSGADYLSTSHRNMERVGMRLLFLRAIWTPLA